MRHRVERKGRGALGLGTRARERKYNKALQSKEASSKWCKRASNRGDCRCNPNVPRVQKSRQIKVVARLVEPPETFFINSVRRFKGPGTVSSWLTITTHAMSIKPHKAKTKVDETARCGHQKKLFWRKKRPRRLLLLSPFLRYLELVSDLAPKNLSASSDDLAWRIHALVLYSSVGL